MSKQDITPTVILHLFKDWAQDHKISLSKPFSIWLCILDAGSFILSRVWAPKPSVCTARAGLVLQRLTEHSAVINTNYADSYHRVQRSFVLTHQAILIHQNIMQRRKLITMTETLTDVTRASKEAICQVSHRVQSTKTIVGHFTCCGSLSRGGPGELFLLLCNP